MLQALALMQGPQLSGPHVHDLFHLLVLAQLLALLLQLLLLLLLL